jgi:hypothetical protein
LFVLRKVEFISLAMFLAVASVSFADQITLKNGDR